MTPDVWTHRGGEHLDEESLGAYLEGRTTDEERADIQAHLASCASCFELFADSADALSDESPDTDLDSADRAVSTHAAFRSRTAWLAGLAAAAVLVLVTWIAVGRSRPSPSGTVEFQTLAAAMREGRPVPGRLAGDYPYGPPVSPVRAGAGTGPRSPRIDAAAARVQSSLEGDDRPDAHHVRGVALLMVQRFDEAISAFESAAAGAPEQARFRSDLSAAYLARGVHTASAADVERALRAADRARALAPNLPAALFNRALALEQLRRTGEARTAWEAYLAADPASEWADEARERMATLDKK